MPLAARPSGSCSRPRARCSGITRWCLRSRASSAAALIECLARGVNRENGCAWKASVRAARQLASSPGIGNSAAFGTKRFCAACLVTPMDWPISVQEAPALRA